MKLRTLAYCGLISATFVGLFKSASAETLYVQAAQTDLKQASAMNAPRVATLKRGDSLDVQEKQGIWYRVTASGNSGWVSKLFVSANKPVGSADLNKEVQVSLEKASRRRSSSYSVAASTRGLSAVGRAREGRDAYESDFDALREIENFSLSTGKLDNFKRSARLGME